RACEELFSAARSEFKHLEYFYFHNCVYENLWRDNRRRFNEHTETFEALHTYPADYKVIFVGDASMSPYELAYPGGSVEHYNPEPGEIWLRRIVDIYSRAVWLNPVAERHWQYTPTIEMIRQIFGHRMYPLTLGGLDDAMRELTR
ncbi:MAG: VWA domain-containing protein, partial [Alphaproteobacteria bacterium]